MIDMVALGRNRYVSWFAQFLEELRVTESVNPAKMKVPGFPELFRIQADNWEVMYSWSKPGISLSPMCRII